MKIPLLSVVTLLNPFPLPPPPSPPPPPLPSHHPSTLHMVNIMCVSQNIYIDTHIYLMI